MVHSAVALRVKASVDALADRPSETNSGRIDLGRDRNAEILELAIEFLLDRRAEADADRGPGERRQRGAERVAEADIVTFETGAGRERDGLASVGPIAEK